MDIQNSRTDFPPHSSVESSNSKGKASPTHSETLLRSAEKVSRSSAAKIDQKWSHLESQSSFYSSTGSRPANRYKWVKESEKHATISKFQSGISNLDRVDSEMVDENIKDFSTEEKELEIFNQVGELRNEKSQFSQADIEEINRRLNDRSKYGRQSEGGEYISASELSDEEIRDSFLDGSLIVPFEGKNIPFDELPEELQEQFLQNLLLHLEGKRSTEKADGDEVEENGVRHERSGRGEADWDRIINAMLANLYKAKEKRSDAEREKRVAEKQRQKAEQQSRLDELAQQEKDKESKQLKEKEAFREEIAHIRELLDEWVKGSIENFAATAEESRHNINNYYPSSRKVVGLDGRVAVVLKLGWAPAPLPTQHVKPPPEP